MESHPAPSSGLDGQAIERLLAQHLFVRTLEMQRMIGGIATHGVRCACGWESDHHPNEGFASSAWIGHFGKHAQALAIQCAALSSHFEEPRPGFVHRVREHLKGLERIALSGDCDFRVIGQLQTWAASVDGMCMAHEAFVAALSAPAAGPEPSSDSVEAVVLHAKLTEVESVDAAACFHELLKRNDPYALTRTIEHVLKARQLARPLSPSPAAIEAAFQAEQHTFGNELECLTAALRAAYAVDFGKAGP
jgi:hypothetical protein